MKRIYLLTLLFTLLLTASISCSTLPTNSTAAMSFAPTNTQAGNPTIKVWVNTLSGVYHCPGTKYYGSTKEGAYMTQKEAQDKGNRPAYGHVCN
jgi:hypothetical protein